MVLPFLGVMAMKGFSSFPKAGTSPSDCLVSYPGHSLGGSYPSADVQSVISTTPADWAIDRCVSVTVGSIVYYGTIWSQLHDL